MTGIDTQSLYCGRDWGSMVAQLLGYARNPSMFDDIRGGIMVRPGSTLAGTTGGGKMVDFSINAASTVWVCK